MYPFSRQFWEDLAMRISGPGGLRFIIQPLVSIALGVRDGLRDAREGEPPYLIGIFFGAAHREKLVSRTIKSLLVPIAIAIVLDAIFQYIIHRTIYPVTAVIVGTFLMGLPYSLTRGVANRIATRIAASRREHEVRE